MQIFIFLLLVIIISIALLIFNSITAVGKLKKAVIITNSVLCAALAFLVVFSVSEKAVTDKDSEQYDIYGQGFLGKVHYYKTEDDYYLIKKTIFLSPKADIAVPKSNAELPAVTEVYDPIMIYCEKDAEIYDMNNRIAIGSEEYYLGDEIVKIRPNYIDLIFLIGVTDTAIMFLFNIMISLLILSRRKERNGAEPDRGT